MDFQENLFGGIPWIVHHMDANEMKLFYQDMHRYEIALSGCDSATYMHCPVLLQ